MSIHGHLEVKTTKASEYREIGYFRQLENKSAAFLSNLAISIVLLPPIKNFNDISFSNYSFGLT